MGVFGIGIPELPVLTATVAIDVVLVPVIRQTTPTSAKVQVRLEQDIREASLSPRRRYNQFYRNGAYPPQLWLDLRRLLALKSVEVLIGAFALHFHRV